MQKINERVSLSKLTPYEKNNKVHTEQGVAQLVENYNTVGIIDPIIVDETYTILAGHKRWLAATKANQDEVDIIKVSGLTDDQKRIYRIANNKLTHNSDWDFNNIEFELEQLKDFDIDALGINFDLSVNFNPTEPEDSEGEGSSPKLVTCPECNHSFVPKGS